MTRCMKGFYKGFEKRSAASFHEMFGWLQMFGAVV